MVISGAAVDSGAVWAVSTQERAAHIAVHIKVAEKDRRYAINVIVSQTGAPRICERVLGVGGGEFLASLTLLLGGAMVGEPVGAAGIGLHFAGAAVFAVAMFGGSFEFLFFEAVVLELLEFGEVSFAVISEAALSQSEVGEVLLRLNRFCLGGEIRRRNRSRIRDGRAPRLPASSG
jgi:hypothetical protein